MNNNTRHISPRGLGLVKHFEGLYLKAYQDTGGVWTIGYGHTGMRHMDGSVKAGRVITEAEADRLLEHDMIRAEVFVQRHVKVDLNQDRFDALVSFSFNTGGLIDEEGEPTMILRTLNLGDFEGAARQFGRWVFDDGRKLKGLVRRRHAEMLLFQGDHEALEDFLD